MANIIHQFAKRGASLFFAKYKIDTIVKNETIGYSLSYMLGRNEGGCLRYDPYDYYPNYSEYEIKERLRIFIESVLRTKNKNKLVTYLDLKSDDELAKAILLNSIKTSVEELYKFLNAEKRRSAFSMFDIFS